MPNVRISDLAAADALAAVDIVPVVQVGGTRRASVVQIRDAVLAGAAELTAADPLAEADAVAVVQGGSARRASVAAVRDAVLAAAWPNLIVNGGCAVAQRDPVALANAFRYGAVDGIAARADGTVEAGTIGQAAAGLGTTGHACALSGVTLSGAAPAVAWRCRIEARDAAMLAGGPAMVACRVRHDADTAVGYTIAVNAADAADDFAAVTAIAASTAPVDVASGTDAALGLTVPDMGACANGVEVIVTAACGAVAGAVFLIADLQLAAGSAAVPVRPRPVGVEAALCRRYLQRIAAGSGRANSASNVQMSLVHPGMRAAPAYSATAPLTLTDMVTADFTQSQAAVGTVHDATADGGRVDLGYFSGLTAGTQMTLTGLGGVVLASAEL